MGRTFADFIFQDGLAAGQKAFGAVLAGGVATNVELGYRSKDGPPRHIVWNGLLKDGLIDAYGRDVTHERTCRRSGASAGRSAPG